VGLARLISRGQSGLDASEVSVEVHIAGGWPAFTITGLPTAAVRESRDRVRAALQNCQYQMPSGRITAHLGPRARRQRQHGRRHEDPREARVPARCGATAAVKRKVLLRGHERPSCEEAAPLYKSWLRTPPPPRSGGARVPAHDAGFGTAAV
jgi:hypothetical protein